MNKIYVILAAVILYTISVFIIGWHYEALRISAKQLKQVDADIARANKKLLDDNKIDTDYEKAVTVIENNKTEVPNEKFDCTIPTAWLRSLANASH